MMLKDKRASLKKELQLKDGLLYQDPGAVAYDARHRTRVIRRLRQRAANLGFSLVDRDTGELLEGAVS